MKAEMNEVEINGVKYYKEAPTNTVPENVNGLTYCMVRTYSAGVFAGWMDISEGVEKTSAVKNARRIWRWYGATCLSGLATSGTVNSNDCRFSEPVDNIYLTEIIEVIPITEQAKKTIDGVAVWKT